MFFFAFRIQIDCGDIKAFALHITTLNMLSRVLHIFSFWLAVLPAKKFTLKKQLYYVMIFNVLLLQYELSLTLLCSSRFFFRSFRCAVFCVLLRFCCCNLQNVLQFSMTLRFFFHTMRNPKNATSEMKKEWEIVHALAEFCFSCALPSLSFVALKNYMWMARILMDREMMMAFQSSLLN